MKLYIDISTTSLRDGDYTRDSGGLNTHIAIDVIDIIHATDIAKGLMMHAQFLEKMYSEIRGPVDDFSTAGYDTYDTYSHSGATNDTNYGPIGPGTKSTYV